MIEAKATCDSVNPQDGGVGRDTAPDFVGSIDVAIPGEKIRFVMLLGDGKWEAEAMDVQGGYHRSIAVTEALARRAAALRAHFESHKYETRIGA